MAQGTVKWFNQKKGFGFIARDDGPDLFVHYKSIKDTGFRTLSEGDVVEYEVQPGPKGESAGNVRVISKQRAEGPSSEMKESLESKLKALRKSSREIHDDINKRLKKR